MGTCSCWAALQFSGIISQFIIVAERSVIHFQYLQVSFWQNCSNVNKQVHIRGCAHQTMQSRINLWNVKILFSYSDFDHCLECRFPPQQMTEKALNDLSLTPLLPLYPERCYLDAMHARIKCPKKGLAICHRHFDLGALGNSAAKSNHKWMKWSHSEWAKWDDSVFTKQVLSPCQEN